MTSVYLFGPARESWSPFMTQRDCLIMAAAAGRATPMCCIQRNMTFYNDEHTNEHHGFQHRSAYYIFGSLSNTLIRLNIHKN